MMHMTDKKMLIGQYELCDCVALPYGSGDRFIACMLLPKSAPDGMDKLIDGLSSESWRAMVDNLSLKVIFSLRLLCEMCATTTTTPLFLLSTAFLTPPLPSQLTL